MTQGCTDNGSGHTYKHLHTFRRCEPQGVTPDDVTLGGFTVSISPIKPASECEDVEDSPIVADLLAGGKPLW